MIINYDNKKYNFVDKSYISLHHNIINFYENILKKEFNYFKNIYISHVLYNKEYKIYHIENEDKLKELNKNNLINNKTHTILLKVDYHEKYIFDLFIPYIKILIISLLIIIRIDIFLSTSYNNHIKSFEDYYILLLYVFTILIIIFIFYYSYKVIYRFIEYVIQSLDKDIGVFMGSYIESYNVIDSYNYKQVNYVDKYKNFLKKIEEIEIKVKEEKED